MSRWSVWGCDGRAPEPKALLAPAEAPGDGLVEDQPRLRAAELWPPLLGLGRWGGVGSLAARRWVGVLVCILRLNGGLSAEVAAATSG